MDLQEVIADAKSRIAAADEKLPMERLIEMAERSIGGEGATGAYRTFQEAIAAPGLSVIAEVKQASPSAGIMCEDFDACEIAYDFEAGEADVVSYVVEPRWHRGSNEQFIEVRDEVSAPLLCRDYVVSPYQVYSAKCLGADAVTLDCALLDDEGLQKCLHVCEDLHMDAIVIAHNATEAKRAVASKALIIGASGRKDIDGIADLEAALTLRELVPTDCLFVIVGGIGSVANAKAALDGGADGIIVGEYLLRAPSSDDRQTMLRELKEIG